MSRTINRSHTAILAVLSVLTVVNLLLAAVNLNRPAMADSATETDSRLSPLPTDDTEAITLTPTGDDADAKSIEIRNRGERLAWGESAHSRAYSTALVYVGKPMSKLLETGQYQERRDALDEELREADRERIEALQALFDEVQGMDQSDAAFQDKVQEFQTLDQEYQMWRAQARQRGEQLNADLIREAYEEFVAAVEVVAENKNIDVVYRFVPTDEPMEPRSQAEAQLMVRSRTVLVYPEGIDITDDVLSELALEIED